MAGIPEQAVGASVGALAAAGVHVAQQQTQWTVAKANAAAGTLMFEPTAAEQYAAALDKLNDCLDEQVYHAKHLQHVVGFGPTIVGEALSRKFAQQGDEALRVLEAHQQLLLDMAWTFQAGKNYLATNAENEQRFQDGP